MRKKVIQDTAILLDKEFHDIAQAFNQFMDADFEPDDRQIFSEMIAWCGVNRSLLQGIFRTVADEPDNDDDSYDEVLSLLSKQAQDAIGKLNAQIEDLQSKGVLG